jgi:hypothetical protein
VRPVDFAVEGLLDAAVVRRLFAHSGITLGRAYGGNGKGDILKRLPNWNQAARHSPWFVLVDLDREPCASVAVKDWLPSPGALMRFRIAVKEVESWLMADRSGLAAFLGIDAEIPADSDGLPDPKSRLLDLCRSSKVSSVKKDMLPRDNYKSLEGPAYASRLAHFVTNRWDVKEAGKHSPSLDKCLKALKNFRKVLSS